MALSINYELNGSVYVQGTNGLVLIESGFNKTLENAYIKIINQNGDKTKIALNIGVYDKKDGNLISTDYFEFIPDLSESAKNFLEQGYMQLKANKYLNAVDILEDDETTTTTS